MCMYVLLLMYIGLVANLYVYIKGGNSQTQCVCVYFGEFGLCSAAII